MRGDPTHAELRVVDLVSQGYTNAEIARRLYITRNTVKTYLDRVGQRLGRTGRAFAVGECYRRGWLPLDDSGPQAPRPRPTRREVVSVRDRQALEAAGLVGERTEAEWLAHPHALDDLLRVLGGTSLATIGKERAAARRLTA